MPPAAEGAGQNAAGGSRAAIQAQASRRRPRSTAGGLAPACARAPQRLPAQDACPQARPPRRPSRSPRAQPAGSGAVGREAELGQPAAVAAPIEVSERGALGNAHVRRPAGPELYIVRIIEEVGGVCGRARVGMGGRVCACVGWGGGGGVVARPKGAVGQVRAQQAAWRAAEGAPCAAAHTRGRGGAARSPRAAPAACPSTPWGGGDFCYTHTGGRSRPGAR